MPTHTNTAIRLRPAEPRDVPVLYQHQLDPEANRLAGTKPRSQEAYRAIWDHIFTDPSLIARVIVAGDQVVGGISVFKQDGHDAVGYWIAREHWGRGIAGRALPLLLREVTVRPLRATVAVHNAASIRALERCGFRRTGTKMGEETERFLPGEVLTFVLDSPCTRTSS